MGIKMDLLKNKQEQIPDEFKDLAKNFAEKGFITTSSENLIKWARTGSSSPKVERSNRPETMHVRSHLQGGDAQLRKV